MLLGDSTEQGLKAKLKTLEEPEEQVSIGKLFESAVKVKQSFVEAKKALVG